MRRLLLGVFFLLAVRGVYQDVYPQQSRVVAIGDIHGDFPALISVLKVAGLISIVTPPPDTDQFPWIRGNNWAWTGGSTFVVQTGDQVDFGGRRADSPDVSSEREVLEFMDLLDEAARLEGGAVISMLGNHEFMNAMREFGWASPKGINDYGGIEQRSKAWSPGAPLISHLATTRPVVLKIGDVVFCHGGVEPNMAALNISTINFLFREVLLGHDISASKKSAFRALQGSRGPLFSRAFAHPRLDCNDLQLSLDRLQARTMILGHTPGLKVVSYCSERVFVIDTQMSRAFGMKRYGETGTLPRYWALEIINGNVFHPIHEPENWSLKAEL